MNAFGGAAFDTAAPMPYVASMSDSGLVEINWDRDMQPPENLIQAKALHDRMTELVTQKVNDLQEITQEYEVLKE